MNRTTHKHGEKQGTAAPLIPLGPYSLEDLRHAAAGCRACPLWKSGTQTVFGEWGGRIITPLLPISAAMVRKG